jgi:Zn-dependent proteases
MDLQGLLLQKILTIPAILIAFTFHEYAHAIVADKLGDKTPRLQGKLTLNPLVHVDIIGFVMIMIAGFGWAKPVETNPSSFKNYYRDDLKVSLAGPIGNLIVGFIGAILLGIFTKIILTLNVNNDLVNIVYTMIYLMIYINVMLFFFNLLPLPGLDGFHVFRDLFPKQFYKVADQMYRLQLIILLLLVGTSLASYIIGPPTKLVVNFFMYIVGKLV